MSGSVSAGRTLNPIDGYARPERNGVARRIAFHDPACRTLGAHCRRALIQVNADTP